MTEMQQEKKLPTSLERARMAARMIVEDKGEDVKILDLRGITQAFDFFVIGSGQSRRQLHSISDDIDDLFEKQLGDSRRSVAGYQESRWVVLDYGDVVVHLFEPETRDFYALEDLWGKGQEVAIDDNTPIPAPESAAVYTDEYDDDEEEDAEEEADDEESDAEESDEANEAADAENENAGE